MIFFLVLSFGWPGGILVRGIDSSFHACLDPDDDEWTGGCPSSGRGRGGTGGGRRSSPCPARASVRSECPALFLWLGWMDPLRGETTRGGEGSVVGHVNDYIHTPDSGACIITRWG